jgi:hypothetical protein
MSQPSASAPSRTRPNAKTRPGPRHRSLSDVPVPRRGGSAIIKPLAGYLDADSRPRELLALPGHGGSVLVLDRDATTLSDRRLLAHLAPDEPSENAALVCRLYLEDAAGHWCRQVQPSDLELTPFALSECCAQVDPVALEARVEVRGVIYRLGAILGERTTAQLCWSRSPGDGDKRDWEQVKLRDVVGALESYEPVRTLTEQALARHREDPTVLSTRLRDEFERLCSSPIVLNRGLREAVLDAIERRGMTMSEIALRCGIIKHDRHGNPSGETSWLARRAGLMPEGGAQSITPWIHSDVLAAIARRGLGISPREVELQ